MQSLLLQARLRRPFERKWPALHDEDVAKVLEPRVEVRLILRVWMRHKDEAAFLHNRGLGSARLGSAGLCVICSILDPC